MTNVHLNLVSNKSKTSSNSKNGSQNTSKTNSDGMSYKEELFSMQRKNNHDNMSRGFDKNGKFYSGHSPDRILNNVTPESTLNNFTIEPTVFTNISTSTANESTQIKGDINNDGKVDDDDVELMGKYLIHEVGEEELYNADLNGKDGIDIVDYQMLLDIIAEMKMQKPTGVKGDINNDGKVDEDDVALMEKYLIHEVGEEEIYNADLNGKDGIDIVDYQMLLDIIAEMKKQKSTEEKDDISNIEKVRIELESPDKRIEYNTYYEQAKGQLLENGEVVDANLIEKIDINNDGKVDWEDLQELRALLNTYAVEEAEETETDTATPPVEEETKPPMLFDALAADFNGDGVVDYRDVESIKEAVLAISEDESMNEDYLEKGMDLNHDGKIDSIDFTLAVNLSQGKEIFDMPGTSKDNPIYRIGKYVCNNPNGEYVSNKYYYIINIDGDDDYYFIGNGDIIDNDRSVILSNNPHRIIVPPYVDVFDNNYDVGVKSRFLMLKCPI